MTERQRERERYENMNDRERERYENMNDRQREREREIQKYK